MKVPEQKAEQLAYMYGLERFGVRLGLEVMQTLLHHLGDPQHQFKSVHITGTNGKGSTAAFMAHVLMAGGYKTGLYTSPDLYSFNERIRINWRPISDVALVKLVAEVREVVAKFQLPVTFFEFTTAVAFLHLARQKVDIAIIEVGMGGDLDATNVIHPLLAIITNVGLDHTKVLGITRQAIARRKAGIIKEGCTVITAEADPALQKFLQKQAAAHQATFYQVQREITVTSKKQTLREQTFTTTGMYEESFTTTLLGKHQLRNACTAIVALHYLKQHGFSQTLRALKKGMAATRWEGRLDVVSQKPLVIADGAHNDDGVRSLIAFLQDLPRRDVLLLGVKRDKQLQVIAQELVPLFARVIVTEGNFEPLPAAELGAAISSHAQQVEVIPSAKAALARAQKLVGSQGTLIVTGSLYLVGDVLGILRHKRARHPGYVAH